MAHEFLSVYPAKLLEYGLAIGYLLLFIPFWRYVQGGRRPRRGAVAAARRRRRPPARHAGAAAPRPAGPGWFQVPAGVHLHPGHTWARLEADGLVAVGADDFAHKLVGPAHVDLPALGEPRDAGRAGARDGRRREDRPMLSPVDGTVVAVNAAAREGPTGSRIRTAPAGCSR